MEYVIAVFMFIINNSSELVGFALPPLVEFLNKDVRKDHERFMVTVITCLFSALILNWNDLSYGSPEQVLSSGGLIFLQSQIVYKLYFKGSNVQNKMQSVLRKQDTAHIPTE